MKRYIVWLLALSIILHWYAKTAVSSYQKAIALTAAHFTKKSKLVRAADLGVHEKVGALTLKEHNPSYT